VSCFSYLNEIEFLFFSSREVTDLKLIKHIVFLFAASALLTVPAGNSVVFAQDEPAMQYTNVNLWVNPEYDDPRLLVMLQGQIESVEAPATVSFLVPYTAEMYSAGSIDIAGNYSGGPPDRKVSDIPGWDEISYTVTSNTFRVEYYDSIIVGQPDKTISYEFRWLYPISNLQVLVQQPTRASNFTVEPPGSAARDSEGFTIFTYSYATLDTSQPPLDFNISYTKADSTPSLSGSSSGSSSNTPLIALIVIAAVVLGVAGLWWWRSQNKRPRTRRAAAVSAPTTSVGSRKAARAARRADTRSGHVPPQKRLPVDRTSVLQNQSGQNSPPVQPDDTPQPVQPEKQSGKNVCPVCGEKTDKTMCPICGTYLK